MEQAAELAKNSDSILLVGLVVLALIVVALIPVMKTLSNIAKDRRKEDFEREGRLIQVVEKNTEVNAALKTLIEKDQKFCADCRQEQRALFRTMFDNQEIANIKLAEIQVTLKDDKEDKEDTINV